MNDIEIKLLNAKLYLNYYKNNNILDRYATIIEGLVIDNDCLSVLKNPNEKLYITLLSKNVNKEEKNKDLEEIEKEHKEENGRLMEKIKELEKQYKILEVEKLRYNIQYLESDISQTPDTAMVYYSMKNCLETLREEKIKLETELQELLEESEK